MPILQTQNCTVWQSTSILWNIANWTWNSCQPVIEAVGALPDRQPWLEQPWEPELSNPFPKNNAQSTKLIEIYGKSNDIKFKQKIKTNGKIKINIKETKLIIREKFDIDIVIDNKKIII